MARPSNALRKLEVLNHERHVVDEAARRLIRREVRPALRAFGLDVVPLARRRPLARMAGKKETRGGVNKWRNRHPKARR